jgi:hypothetical protein
MIPAAPPALKPGNPLTLDYLNSTGDLIASGRLKVDPRTGLKLVVTPFGAFLRALVPAAGWYRVASASGGGAYALVEQVDQPGGTWADGPGSVPVAYEANLIASVAVGAVVWARRKWGVWRFSFGACS